MLTKVSKEDINGHDLYFLKKAQLIIAIVIMILTQFAIALGAYYTVKSLCEQNAAEIEHNTERINLHVDNKNVHMTYEAKIKEFVPRGEFNDIKDDISEIKADVKSIEKMVREQK